MYVVPATYTGVHVQVSRMQHQKVLGNWEKLFCHVMLNKSHGRRWKFRIEPLRRKLERGYNPYLSDADSDSDMRSQDSGGEEVLFQVSGRKALGVWLALKWIIMAAD